MTEGSHDAREIEAFYRRCAVLRRRFQDAALRSVPVPKVMEHAERLGLPVGRGALTQVAEGDLDYAFDLAVHTAPPGRSRAIERIGRAQGRTAEGEARLVLRALETAWFSVFRVRDGHPLAGLVLEDALLGGEAWVVDEALTESAVPGTILATRIGRVCGFAITCGVVAGLNEAMLATCRRIAAAAGLTPAELAAEPRFATMLYRQALGIDILDEFGGA